MSAPPDGTVTFLFTDIEGSTRLLQAPPERYGELLSEHRRLLRHAFAANGGREVGTEGDGFFVAFARARDAVEAAVDAQRSLTAHRWPDGIVPRVRMGLHTSEATWTDEGYVGLGVHRAARICDAGHGGQILLSNATREVLADDRVDAPEIRRGDPEVCVPELALDDDQRHAFAGHLEGMRVTELMRREALAHTGARGGVAQLGARGAGRPRASTRRAGGDAQQRPDRQVHARGDPGLR